MAYTLVKNGNSVAIMSRDQTQIANGTAIASVITPLDVAVPHKSSDNKGIAFRSSTGIVGTLIQSDETYIKENPTDAEYEWTGTTDELINFINETLLAPSMAGGTNPTGMNSIVWVETASDLPTPTPSTSQNGGDFSTITLEAGITYCFVGQSLQNDSKSKVIIPADTVLIVEHGAVILGNFAGTSVLETAGLKEVGDPNASQDYPFSFIKFKGSSRVRNITIDGKGTSRQLVNLSDSPTATHLWDQVEFKDGGLVNQTYSLGGVGFQMNTFLNLKASTCAFNNTGSFNFNNPDNIFVAKECEDVLFHCCMFNFNIGNQFLFTLAETWKLNNAFSIERCKGVFDTLNGGMIQNSLDLSNQRAQIEGIRVVDCDFDFVNGEGYKGLGIVANQVGIDGPQTYFRGNKGFHNNAVGLATKTDYADNSYPETVLTLGNYVDLQADLTAPTGAGIEDSTNLSRLWEITNVSGVSLMEYKAKKQRTFNIRKVITLSSGSNRELRSKTLIAKKATPTVFMDIPMSTAKLTSNGSTRPETMVAEFQITVEEGDILKEQIANFSNNNNADTQIVSFFSTEV